MGGGADVVSGRPAPLLPYVPRRIAARRSAVLLHTVADLHDVDVIGKLGDVSEALEKKSLRDFIVDIEVVDNPECFSLMENFIKSHRSLWNEDIGV